MDLSLWSMIDAASVQRATRTKLTPPQIAEAWGISPEKVLRWIKIGELRALNCATRRRGRPRYLVDVEDLKAFETGRRVCAPPVPSPRRRRRAAGLPHYFR
jgi:hypothetical protein